MRSRRCTRTASAGCPWSTLTGELQGILTLDDLVELLSEELADLAKRVLREQRRERLHQIEA
jgi:hypothetical protein